jgi:preprotein translocase subunit SecD
MACWACSASEKAKAADWQQVPVSIELRLAEGSPAPGLVPAVVHGQGRTVYLHSEPRISNTDIARVEAVKTRIGQGLILQVWLTRAGAKRLAELTGRHIGDSLAVLINSIVVSVPPIQDTLDSGTQMPNDIGVPLGPEEAGELAQAVSKTWPVSRRNTGR